MTTRFRGIWRLTRFQEYVSFVVITTLLGAAAGGGSLHIPLITVLIANLFAVGFAFMVNDVEDAPDDALNPAKASRNPVSSGALSPRIARLLSFAVGLISLVLYTSLGLRPFLAGMASLTLGFLYSSRSVRLKATPIFDLVSHALMLAGLQFLAAYLTFEGAPMPRWVFPLVLVLAVSLYGQLFNELRDFEGDVQAGIHHTAALLGRRASSFLMMAWFAVGIAAAVVTILSVRLVPNWVLALMAALAALLSWNRLWRVRHARSTIDLHQPFQKPVEIAVALGLAAWFASPMLLAPFN